MTGPTSTTSRRRLLVTAGVTVLLVVATLGGVLGLVWALQRHLVFDPDASPVPAAGDAIVGARDVTLRTEDGLELGAWYVPAAVRADHGLAVLVAPGNAGNRAGRAGLARELSDRGFAVLLMDYRGYAGNPGRPSEPGLAADVDAAVEALTALGHPPEQTVYFGESLGTGVVAALQARRPPAGVVLRSPFPSLVDVGSHHHPWLPVRTLLSDRFPVVPHVEHGEVPTSVVYGVRDSVVPAALSEEVAAAVPVLVERVVLDADHNDAAMLGLGVADVVARLAAEVR